MSAPLDVLLSRLDGVRQVKANGWMARCPAHNGDGRSLAVTDKDNGYILMHCFAHECEVGDILAAVGMSVGDLFPDRLPERQYPRMKHAISPIDVLRVMKHELTALQIIASDFSRGEHSPDSCARASKIAERIRKALDLCDA